MMKQIVAAVAVLIFFSSCEKTKLEGVPQCINSKIQKIKNQPRWNPPASVTEYRYNDKKVYLFSSDCCDRFEELFDEDCNYICAPGGGITGKGDMKCTDFYQKAVFVKLVWKDER
jgi:hypothetical protein